MYDEVKVCQYSSALHSFMNYFFESSVKELYMQTWSGNIRMLRCVDKLGVAECNRTIGTRTVAGQTYDGLTFKIAK